MNDSIPTQLRFPASAGFTVRAQFDGGALSSDFGAILLRGTDLQTGLISRLAGAIHDKRHPSYISHSMTDLLRQRVFQSACGYADGNDANALRADPMFKLAAGRAPLDADTDLASGPTLSRLENNLTRRDIYRLAKSFVHAFIDSYAQAPALIVLDMDHFEDPTHGQQELAFYNHHYRHHCYMPLFLFEGLSGKLITAILRPGKRPTGRENAAIIARVVRALRQAWPDTHIILRGDGHFSNPELMALCEQDPAMDFIFGLAGNKVLLPLAQPLLERAKSHYQSRCESARHLGLPAPGATRLYDDLSYQAGTWPKAYRVVLKAEVMALGENPRFVVSSLNEPTAELLYRELYCARGQDENYIKAIKNDRASDRTSDHTFLANHMRMFYACAAYVLIHSLRENTLAHTELARAQPGTIILKLFKLAVRVVQYKDRIRLSLPTGCPVKGILERVTELLYQTQRPPAPA
ncbi:IS1380 family transposase [Orrella marina]|uniref:IS1380 family transposase n=1 Tax=Orrella marina TaxID=2163011 RepID=A0A2R4XJX2_9BURK|nr:IS1380 family transposase [Orrella marina]AWB34132.1 IS1380 family transposase [Orrella marina]